MIVILDPGHDKNTAGKRSPDGSLREFEFNQTVANMAEEMLLKYADIKVILTKQMNDVNVSLSHRSQIANNANADIFLSIHANAHGDGNTWTTANGFEIYHYPGSASGRNLAEIGHKHAISKTGLRDRGIKSENFHVLRETKMPAVLFEFGFMTNRAECELLKTPEFRKACVEAVVLTVLEKGGIEKLEGIEPRLIFQGRDLKNFIVINQVVFLYVGGHYIPVREIGHALGLNVKWDPYMKVAYVAYID